MSCTKTNFVLSDPLEEFVKLDEQLTDQLLSLQAKAVELGLLAQKFEDEGNAYYESTLKKVSIVA